MCVMPRHPRNSKLRNSMLVYVVPQCMLRALSSVECMVYPLHSGAGIIF